MKMASAITHLACNTLRSEFRRIDPASARILLIDRSRRVLGFSSEDLSGAAKRRLEEGGVEVLLGSTVEQVDARGVILGGSGS